MSRSMTMDSREGVWAMTVHDIVIEWLKDHNADGLCCDECGCDGDVPCEGDYRDCVPAKKVIATEEHYDPEYSEFQIGDEIFVPVFKTLEPNNG